MYPSKTLRGRQLDTISRDFIVNIASRVAKPLTVSALRTSLIAVSYTHLTLPTNREV